MRHAHRHRARAKHSLIQRIIAVITAIVMMSGIGYAAVAMADEETPRANQQIEKSPENAADAQSDDDAAVAKQPPMLDASAKALGSPVKGKRIKKHGDGTYTVNMDVTGTVNSATVVSSQPIDFTLALDVSGSMKEGFGGTSKMAALQTAVNGFLDGAARANAGSRPGSSPVRVGLVKFAGDRMDRIGNDIAPYYPYYNYSQIVSTLTDNMAGLKNVVNGFMSSGATRADFGLEHAYRVMSGSRSNAKQVVLFFTDGTPTSGNMFEGAVANAAVWNARALKGRNVTIYSIGVFNGANPSSTMDAANLFMHAVSSNFPNATSYMNLGQGNVRAGYYKTAANAAELNAIFNEIQKSETTSSAYTNVVMEDTLSEYVDLSDKNYGLSARDANGKAVSLTNNVDYTLAYNTAARKFTVRFLKPLGNGVTYTLSYRVKATQKAYDDFAANHGYGKTVGDAGTDLPGNNSSSNKPGFRSNAAACLGYTANGVTHACGSNPYPHPVIQAVSGQIDVTKTWGGDDSATTFTLTKKGDRSFTRTLTASKGSDGRWRGSVTDLAPGTYTVTAAPGHTVDGEATRTVVISEDGLWAAWRRLNPQHDDNVKVHEVAFTSVRNVVSLKPNVIIAKQAAGHAYSGSFKFHLTGPDRGGHSDAYIKPASDPAVTLTDFTADETKTATLDETLRFRAPVSGVDEYAFHLTEVQDNKPLWRFDQSDYKVVVKVDSTKAWISSITQIRNIDGNEVNTPVCWDDGKQPKVSFVNRYSTVAVTALPLTGGSTDRPWLLVSIAVAGTAVLLIGATVVWRRTKRRV